MDLKDQTIQKVTDPDRIDELQFKKFTNPTLGLIRRQHTLMAQHGGGGGPPSIPYWYPAAGKANIAIERKPVYLQKVDQLQVHGLHHIPGINTSQFLLYRQN